MNCNAEMRAIEVDQAGIRKNIACLNDSINALIRENTRLKKRVKALENLVGALPAPWSNVDGVITADPDRPIGSATFLLSSRSTGGASALAIDQEVMEGLCNTGGGCTLVVSFKQLSLFNKTPKESVLSGPCQFTYAPKSGDWTVGAGCGAQAATGNDGDGGLGGEAANSVEIAVAGGACILADSGLAKAVGAEEGLAPDRSKGLFLIAMPSRQSGPSRRFQCEVALE